MSECSRDRGSGSLRVYGPIQKGVGWEGQWCFGDVYIATGLASFGCKKREATEEDICSSVGRAREVDGDEEEKVRRKKTQKSTKRMTGVDEDFLGGFAKSERGLGAAAALGRNRSMTELEMV